jgi:hypothetical protein
VRKPIDSRLVAGAAVPDEVVARVADDAPSTNGAGAAGSRSTWAPRWGPPATSGAKKGKKPYILADLPQRDDRAGLCEWLTLNLGLDPEHPITNGCRFGTHDHDGIALLYRRNAPELRFTPITRLSTPARLTETLIGCLTSTDGVIPPFTNDHIAYITSAVRWLCEITDEQSHVERFNAITGTFLAGAEPIEEKLTTYNTTSPQRYELADKLRPQRDEHNRPLPPRYLVDRNSGELIIGVGDLQTAARAAEGTSLRRGELDTLLVERGWKRITIEGRGHPGRPQARGPHLRLYAYRGLLPVVHNPDDAPDDAATPSTEDPA